MFGRDFCSIEHLLNFIFIHEDYFEPLVFTYVD